MKTNENNSKRIYDKGTRQWFEVAPEQYAEFDRWRTNLRKREQYHGRCMCPRNKWWLCDGMCDDCEFHAAGDVLSLDKPISTEADDDVSLLNTLTDPSLSIEDVICDKAELDQLFKRLNEIMPEAAEIGRLRMKKLSDETIAEIIGIKRTTFLSRLKKATEKLSAEFPERF